MGLTKDMKLRDSIENWIYDHSIRIKCVHGNKDNHIDQLEALIQKEVKEGKKMEIDRFKHAFLKLDDATLIYNKQDKVFMLPLDKFFNSLEDQGEEVFNIKKTGSKTIGYQGCDCREAYICPMHFKSPKEPKTREKRER